MGALMVINLTQISGVKLTLPVKEIMRVVRWSCSGCGNGSRDRDYKSTVAPLCSVKFYLVLSRLPYSASLIPDFLCSMFLQLRSSRLFSRFLSPSDRVDYKGFLVPST